MSAAEPDEIPVLRDVLQYGGKRKADNQDTLAAPPVRADASTEGESESSSRDAAVPDGDPGNPPDTAGRIAALVSSFSRADWEALEHKVRESVLNELQMKIEDHMIEAIDEALARLGAELKRSLRENLREAVAEAVSREIALLQTFPPEETRRS